MPAAYSFVTRWHITVPVDRAWTEIERMISIRAQSEHSIRRLHPGAERTWWPGLTLPMPARRLAAGERMVLAVRSPLGYRLRMLLEISDVDPGRSIEAISRGDLRGTGRVSVAADGAGASVVTFRWNVETDRVWMNTTAWLLRPVFERAHAHVMRRGERGLREVIARA
jgi:hypothetical protein